MYLNLPSNFKSLEPFEIELPDFVLLTGLNGAGKTQLLSAIENQLIRVTDSRSSENLTKRKYVTGHTLAPNESVVVTSEQLKINAANLWNFHSGFDPSFQPNQDDIIKYYSSDLNYFKVLNKISQISGKPLEAISLKDIHNYYPVEDGIHHQGIFYQNLASLFKRYLDKLEENEFKEYKNKVKGDKDAEFLEKWQFVAAYGEPPWDLINKIILSAHLDFLVNSPIGLHRDSPFELKLTNRLNGAEIRFNDLSSGEKVLMSLVLALYNSKYDIEFPEVLLMDEPDASLHPSMTKKFLDVVKNVFVEEKKMKVIITTHSPSTIALAPEESVFLINKIGKRVEKASKDKALKILLSGVPSISLNYQNRRQVFVESPNDVLFYERIYHKLSDILIPEISLSFISSGESRTDKNGAKVSNCSQVINITNTLRKAGNTQVWGIIDWDLTNQESDFVKVLGNGNRYSIESYIFDPVLLAALLLREKIVSKDELGLVSNENYLDLKNFDNIRLQNIVDLIIKKIEAHATSSSDDETLTVKLINGIQINIPIWYLHYQGHELEDAILVAFPQLNSIKKGKEENLKIEIINKVIDDMPEMVSEDILNVYKKVQSVN